VSSDGRHRGVGKLVPQRPPERLQTAKPRHANPEVPGRRAQGVELATNGRAAGGPRPVSVNSTTQPGGRVAGRNESRTEVMGTNRKSLHKPQSVTQFSPDYGKHAVLLNIFWIYTAPRLG